ncbi:zwei Ig domain protein zig-8-like [Ischnura elegans]|uniref:zwei Ig domain protein zig-8-like n=1 Tax=Ischnura elegans TaxID=197161 RepID=UPI001ED884CD|nr:zwei Ig domain protein zig-8-like [Ischnura elegans]
MAMAVVGCRCLQRGGPRDGRILLATVHILSLICQALSEEPRFAEPIPNVTVALGQDASLPCVVEHLGTYMVTWIRLDRREILAINTLVITRMPRILVSYDNQKTWLLHVASVQQEDRGYYMCQVNSDPIISQVGYLQVVENLPSPTLPSSSSDSEKAVTKRDNKRKSPEKGRGRKNGVGDAGAAASSGAATPTPGHSSVLSTVVRWPMPHIVVAGVVVAFCGSLSGGQ